MKIPETHQPDRYVGLYVIDLDEHCALGYTAEEVASLLESQRFAHAKVYKIHRAQPDGTLELHGVSPSRFNLESGMFFHCLDENTSEQDYEQLLAWSGEQLPPCRAKLQLARCQDDKLIIALIYPGEYEQEMAAWLKDSGFRGRGPVDAGPSQVTRFYQASADVLRHQQLMPGDSLRARDRDELLATINEPLQRNFA